MVFEQCFHLVFSSMSPCEPCARLVLALGPVLVGESPDKVLAKFRNHDSRDLIFETCHGALRHSSSLKGVL